jgi:Flp pilus assembly pilin Flp
MKQKKKAQEFLVYAMLITVIAAVLVIMSSYISRRIMGVYQSAGDSIGGGEIQD